jgi:hypothetical protein
MYAQWPVTAEQPLLADDVCPVGSWQMWFVISGREAPGKAFRLYTEDSFAGLAATTSPEITRVNLGSVVLRLKALGVRDVASFDFMDPPPAASVIRWVVSVRDDRSGCSSTRAAAERRPLGSKLYRAGLRMMQSV